MTAPNTNWHVIVAAVLVTVVDVVMLLVLGATKETISTIGIVDGVLLGLIAQSGLLQAADAQRVEKIAESVAPQIAASVQVVEKTFTAQHADSTAGVAALHTAVSVVAAKAGVSLPPPQSVIDHAKSLASVVDDELVSRTQNKPVKL
jgi:hypothetical protein